MEKQPGIISHDKTASKVRGQVFISESGSPELIIVEKQPEIIYEDQSLSGVRGQVFISESGSPELIIVEKQPDLPGHEDLSQPVNPEIVLIKDQPEVCHYHAEPPSDVQGPMGLSGESPFQRIHQGNALIPPRDYSRHFSARKNTDGAVTLQESENKNSDYGETVFQSLNQRFASLIGRRKRRFNGLPSKTRRKLTYDP